MKKVSKHVLGEELHKVLRGRLQSAGLKQADIVYYTGFTQTYVSQIMTGAKFPPLDTLCDICDVLDVPVHQVLYEAYLRATMKKEILSNHIGIKFREMELSINSFYNTAI